MIRNGMTIAAVMYEMKSHYIWWQFDRQKVFDSGESILYYHNGENTIVLKFDKQQRLRFTEYLDFRV